MQVMDAAKGIMRQSGNMHQWGDGYPSETVISADMEKNSGFVIEDSGEIVGYFAFLQSPEPTYNKIYDGQWLDDTQPYHVVHRIASYADAHGIFDNIMDFCFSHDTNIHAAQHPEAWLHLLRHHLSAIGRCEAGLSKNRLKNKTPSPADLLLSGQRGYQIVVSL